jgi:hypothetical protein
MQVGTGILDLIPAPVDLDECVGDNVMSRGSRAQEQERPPDLGVMLPLVERAVTGVDRQHRQRVG